MPREFKIRPLLKYERKVPYNFVSNRIFQNTNSKEKFDSLMIQRIRMGLNPYDIHQNSGVFKPWPFAQLLEESPVCKEHKSTACLHYALLDTNAVG